MASSAYPPENIPEPRKDAKWIAATAWAFLQEAKNSKLFHYWPPSNNLTLDELRRYMRLEQSPARTKRYEREPTLDNPIQGAGVFNLNPGVLSVVPPFVRQFLSMMGRQSVTVNVTSYDTQPDGSLSPVAAATAKGSAVMRQAGMLQQMGLDPATVLGEQVPEMAGTPLPVDEQHLRYQVSRKVRDAAPADVQAGINKAFKKWGLIEAKEEIGLGLFEQNAAVVYTPLNAPHIPQCIAPEIYVTLPSRYMDFHDCRAQGFYVRLTIGEVKAEILAADARASAGPRKKAKDQKEKRPDPVSTMPTEAQWRELALANDWKEGGPETLTRGEGDSTVRVYPYDSHRVKLLRFFIRSESEVKLRHGKSRLGNSFARRGEKAGNEGELLTASEKWLYTGLLVPDRTNENGDPWAFACEKALNQPRDPAFPGEVPMPCVAVRRHGPSVLEEMVPVVDRIQYAWQRLDEDMKRTLPANENFDQAGLTTMALQAGAKGTAFSEQDIIKIRQMYGMGIGNTDPDPEATNPTRRPFPFSSNGATMAATVMEYLGFIREMGAELSRITGLNDVATGLNPGSRERLGKAGGEQALAAAQQAVDAWVQTLRFCIEGTAYRVMLGIAGDMKLTKAIELRCDVGDNREAWDRLNALSTKAMDTGAVALADVFEVERMADIYQAQDYLAARDKEAREQAKQDAAAASQNNGGQQAQSIQAKAEADLQLAEREHEMRMEELAYQRETLTLQTRDRESAATERAIIQATGQVDQQTAALAHAGEQALADRVAKILADQAQRDHERELADQEAAMQAAQQTAEPAAAMT